MKTLQNNFTTPEQSKKLLELGVPANSADMFWIASDEKYPSTELVWNLYIRTSDSLDKNFFKTYNMNEFQVIPCWSVGRLMEIYDMCFISPKSRSSWCTHTRVKGVLFVDYILDCYKNAITDKLLDFSKLEA